MRAVLVSALLILLACQAGTSQSTSKISEASADGPVTEGYFAGADGVRLFYRKIGKGKTTAVFLHGGPRLGIGDGGYDLEPLARNRTLIMYDQRGGGRSDIVTDPKLLTLATNPCGLVIIHPF